MSKQNKKGGNAGTATAAKTAPVVTVPEMNVTTNNSTTTVEKRKPGRPKDPNKVVKEKGPQGRPVVPGSARQIREAARLEKAKAGLLKRGRPKEDPAVLEQRRAERKAAKQAAMQALIASSQKIADEANALIEEVGNQ